MTQDTPKRIILLDSSGPLHRCFHGYVNPRPGVLDGKTLDVAAIYGYMEYVRKLSSEMDYDVLIHVLDPEGGSHFRFNLYPEYKGQRSPTPPVLTGQKMLLKSILEAYGQICVKLNGVESDDVIATLAQKYVAEGHDVLVVSQDKDLMQLVADGKIALARYVENGPGQRKTHEFYEEQDVQKAFGVRPDQVPDWLALVGDASDNIPGVHKVGEKTATKWLEEYGNLSALMTNAASVPGAAGQRLRDTLHLLPLYRQLTTVLLDVKIDTIYDRPQHSEEKNQWARQVLNAPDHWPQDLTGDLREPVTTPTGPVAPKF